MSNGPKLGMSQTPRLIQTQHLGVYLAPLMTPVVRRLRDDRPMEPDDTPWRDARANRR